VRSEGKAVVQDLNNRAVHRSRFDRAIRRRDAIGLAILFALGLAESDAGWRLSKRDAGAPRL
jgi:hypothetical protein